MNNINNLGISMRNSADIQAHSISIIKDNRVVSLEDYITEIAGDRGGGGGDGYTQTETDNLLNNKLNVNNPQDITGNLRLDPTNGLSKIILNAVSPPNANDDFYCNGNGHFNGTLRVSILSSDGDVNCDRVNADVFNSNVITNDIVFNHNDNEYLRFNSTDDEIQLSKDIDVGSSTLHCNNFDSGLSDVVFNLNSDEFLRLQLSDNTVRFPNTKSFLSQNIFTDDIKPLAFANDVVFNGGNSTNGAYEEYVRLDASTEKVNISKETKFENAIQLNQGQSIKWTNVFIREVQGATRPEFDLIVNGSTSHLRLWVNGAFKQAITNTVIACKVSIDAEQGITVFNGQQLKSNTLNSHTNSNLVLQRDGSTYMTFQSNRIDIDQPLHLANSLTIDLADKLTMRPNLEGGVNIFDIRNLHPIVDNPMIRFRVGDGAGETIVCEMSNNAVSFQRNLIVGTAFELRTNAIDTVNDSPLLFNRNDNEIMRFENYTDVNSGNETYPLINVEATARLSCNHVYITHILNRAGQFDNTFQGSNALGTARVEYMRWNYSDQSLDFNAPIDNTNIAVIGNIVDTTVSDERLKTNVQDVESNYCGCVKNVKIKTFEYKDEKYKNSDKYGFIAQHLQKHLPKEFKNIVKETKPKRHEGEAYLSINYMKLSVVLWGALQETLTKVEHLESRLFELEDIVKEMRGKGKGEATPKAKAKSKEKAWK